jgi:2-polyprenyl-3-methyl-5-hydroxy-6-metoxy-1,4-benzoquinol methylase
MQKTYENPGQALKRSWDKNAESWTKIVREDRIPSRAAGTDQAIVDAVAGLRPGRVMDVGCGEGWLVRRLVKELECDVVGVDGSPALIANAKTVHRDGKYSVLTYEAFSAKPNLLQGPFDVAVCNFALLGRELAPILRALKGCLNPNGTLLVQTLHPWFSCGENSYADGWREESFSAFTHGVWEPMPWYFRTLESWHREIRSAGLRLTDCREPAGAESHQPLSLLLSCSAAG